MEVDIPDNLPEHVTVGQFNRIKARVGFESGREEVVEYDERQSMNEYEVHFRRYIERDADEPLRGGQFRLPEDLPDRTILRAYGRRVESRKFIESQPLYMLSLGYGQRIRILTPEEVESELNALSISAEAEAGNDSPAEPTPTSEEAEESAPATPETTAPVEVGDWDEPEPVEEEETTQSTEEASEPDAPITEPVTEEEVEEVEIGDWDGPDEDGDEDEEAEPVEA